MSTILKHSTFRIKSLKYHPLSQSVIASLEKGGCFAESVLMEETEKSLTWHFQSTPSRLSCVARVYDCSDGVFLLFEAAFGLAEGLNANPTLMMNLLINNGEIPFIPRIGINGTFIVAQVRAKSELLKLTSIYDLLEQTINFAFQIRLELSSLPGFMPFYPIEEEYQRRIEPSSSPGNDSVG